MDEYVRKIYAILELPETATEREVDEGYRMLVKRCQEDQASGDPSKKQEAWDRLKEIGMAYDTLKRYLSEINAPPVSQYQRDLPPPPPPSVRSRSPVVIAVVAVVLCIAIGYFFLANKREHPARAPNAGSQVRVFTAPG